jgi:transposase
LAFKRGEPRVCSMARAPTPEEEDRRRICRERKALIAERMRRVNRIKGLLFSQGIGDYEPLRRDRRRALEALGGGDGRPLGLNLKAQIGRELDRLELPLDQIRAVEAAAVEAAAVETEAAPLPPTTPSPARMLLRLKGVGPEFAAILRTEGLCRSFASRRQIAAYASLAPTPWRSGTIGREQSVSKAGDPRLCTTMIQLAWLWSALARWFHQRLSGAGKGRRKTTIVALARKLLVALWKFASAGVVIEGALMKGGAANG